jgi:hypothetical protein
MPVTGIPDRSMHRLCYQCRCWFYPHEGVLDYPPVRGPLSFLFSLSRHFFEDESKRKFFCDACHQKITQRAQTGRKSVRWLIGSLIVLIIAAYIAWATGWLQSLLQLH